MAVLHSPSPRAMQEAAGAIYTIVADSEENKAPVVADRGWVDTLELLRRMHAWHLVLKGFTFSSHVLFHVQGRADGGVWVCRTVSGWEEKLKKIVFKRDFSFVQQVEMEKQQSKI